MGQIFKYYVYAIRADCNPVMVKFGISRDPEKRLASLQTGSPVSLELMCFVGASRSLEAQIHNSLRHLRKHGEWFSYEYEAIEIADLIAAGDAWLVYQRVFELSQQLYQSALDSHPDQPDKKYWGNREECGTDAYQLAQFCKYFKIN